MGGTILNVAAILLGGLIGLSGRKPLPPEREAFVKVALGAFAVFYGLRLTWLSLGGSIGHALKQLLIAVLAMTLGKLTGRLLRLQRMSNRLGQAARERMERAGKPIGADGVTGDECRVTSGASPVTRHSPLVTDGFKVCAALFCAAPLAVLGSVQDGLSGYFYPLAVKAVMDGLGAMGFATVFRWGVLLSALPVLAFQGTITLLCARWLQPLLAAHGLLDSVNAVGGLLVFCVALVILGLKKIELADYLPSLAFAPLIAWVWG